MMEVCFVCNKTLSNLYHNITKLKSTHSATAISEFIKRFLAESESCRNINDESNCICAECFKQISFYDIYHTKAVEQEAKLKRILLETEAFFKRKNIEVKVDNEIESIFFGSIHSANAAKLIESDEMIESEPVDVIKVSETKVKPQLSNGRDEASFNSATQRQEATMHLATENLEAVVEAVHPNRCTAETPFKTPLKPSNSKSNRNIPSRICELCERSVSIKSYGFHLRDHRRRVQKSLERECSICKNGILFTRRRYEFHMRTKHTAECELCDHPIKSSDAKSMELKHRKWHEEHPRLMCVVCNHRLKDIETLKAHVKLHESRPKWQCLICDKTYPGLNRLKMHTKIHGEREKLCELCGKAFVTEQSLQNHMAAHTTARMLKCPKVKCPKTFKRHSNLMTHLSSVHSDERPFSCSFCDMKFKRKTNLKFHERRHTEDTKTEKCTICAAAYEHKLHLKQHMERKHKVEISHGP